MITSKSYVRTAGDALVYWADCAVATYTGLMMKKSSSKCEKERQLSIAQGMIDHAKMFGAAPEDVTCVQDRLNRSKEFIP